MTKDSKPAADRLVMSTPAAPVELSEAALDLVAGGDANKTSTTTTKSDKQTYLTVTLHDALIS